MTVVGEAVDGSEAVDLARAHHPDVVLMDIRMPGTDGLAATVTICSDPDLADTRVLILTTFENDEYVAKALRAGASGFLGKDVSTDVLLTGIRTVAAGESLLSPSQPGHSSPASWPRPNLKPSWHPQSVSMTSPPANAK